MFKSGFVSVVGQPNVGKSTLLNALLKKKISIVSHKPQTTRNKIIGILHKKDAQIILMDTPGFFASKRGIDKIMVSTARKALREGEVVLFITDVTRRVENIKESFDFINGNQEAPALLVLNKVDLIAKEKLLPLIEEFSKSGIFKEIIPISALKEENLEALTKTIASFLPEGPKYFPEDMCTDQAESFLISEIIREKVFRFTHKEIPYSSYVTIESIKEGKKKNKLEIEATIFVEKDSQKPILIGKGGSMMKIIREQAQKEIAKILGVKVYLSIWVKVRQGWRVDQKQLERLIK